MARLCGCLKTVGSSSRRQALIDCRIGHHRFGPSTEASGGIVRRICLDCGSVVDRSDGSRNLQDHRILYHRADPLPHSHPDPAKAGPCLTDPVDRTWRPHSTRCRLHTDSLPGVPGAEAARNLVESGPMVKPIAASGGLVVRPSPAGPRILVIHRPRYDDWTFPKGKERSRRRLARGGFPRGQRRDRPASAPGFGLVGETTYPVDGTTKLVRWYGMRVAEPGSVRPQRRGRRDSLARPRRGPRPP